jgi:hypothetical protein
MRAEQQMKVIGHECPGKAFSVRHREQFRESLEKQPAVIIKEDIPSFDASDDNMLQKIRKVYACSSWHGAMIAEVKKLVNNSTTFIVPRKNDAPGTDHPPGALQILPVFFH